VCSTFIAPYLSLCHNLPLWNSQSKFGGGCRMPGNKVYKNQNSNRKFKMNSRERNNRIPMTPRMQTMETPITYRLLSSMVYISPSLPHDMLGDFDVRVGRMPSSMPHASAKRQKESPRFKPFKVDRTFECNICHQKFTSRGHRTRHLKNACSGKSFHQFLTRC